MLYLLGPVLGAYYRVHIGSFILVGAPFYGHDVRGPSPNTRLLARAWVTWGMGRLQPIKICRLWAFILRPPDLTACRGAKKMV